ncbi:MAG: integrase core domain-containing protein [Candidatus Saccharimonadales bacterium]
MHYARDFEKARQKQSFSHPGRLHDNAVIESFFASLKREELYRGSYKSEYDLRESPKKYIHFYNTARPHHHITFKTPDQHEGSNWNNLRNKD